MYVYVWPGCSLACMLNYSYNEYVYLYYSSTNEKLICTTTSLSKDEKRIDQPLPVYVAWTKGGMIMYHHQHFTYKPDPIIFSISPQKTILR